MRVIGRKVALELPCWGKRPLGREILDGIFCLGDGSFARGGSKSGSAGEQCVTVLSVMGWDVGKLGGSLTANREEEGR